MDENAKAKKQSVIWDFLGIMPKCCVLGKNFFRLRDI